MCIDMNWLRGASVTSVVALPDSPGAIEVRTRGGAWIALQSAWQLRSAASVILASGDEGQSYGRDEPRVVAAIADEVLATRAIISASVEPVSGELTLMLDGDYVLVSFNNSSGYEGWHIGRSDGLEWIAQGGGRIVQLGSTANA